MLNLQLVEFFKNSYKQLFFISLGFFVLVHIVLIVVNNLDSNSRVPVALLFSLPPISEAFYLILFMSASSGILQIFYFCLFIIYMSAVVIIPITLFGFIFWKIIKKENKIPEQQPQQSKKARGAMYFFFLTLIILAVIIGYLQYFKFIRMSGN